MSDLERIEHFISEHHQLSLATFAEGVLSACTVFFVYDNKNTSFIFASSEESEHSQNIIHSPSVAASIAVETKEVGIIKGLQIKGSASLSKSKMHSKRYYNVFPYARLIKSVFWVLHVEQFKFTDNRLGFGKKLLWNRPTQ